MNGWFLIALLGILIGAAVYIGSTIENRSAKYMDQVGPWGIAFLFPIGTAAFCAGVIAGKIPGNEVLSRLVFVIIAALVGTLMTKLFQTAPSGEEVLYQDPIFGKNDPATGIRIYLRVKSGKLFGRLPHVIKPKDVTGVTLQRHLTDPKDVELEPKKGPATLQGKMSAAWSKNMATINVYNQLKTTEAERIKYVNDRLERAALSAAGTIAKSEYEGEEILSNTLQFADRVRAQVQLVADTLSVTVEQVIFSGLDYNEGYKKVLNDIALAEKLNGVARTLAGLKVGEDFPNTPEGREERFDWLEEAKIATGIGDIRKEIFDVQGLGNLSKEEAAKIAAEIFARSKKEPRK